MNIRQGAQQAPGHLARNPSGEVPEIEGPDGFVPSGSAAILVHLADTNGGPMPGDARGRARVSEQLFLHASGLGPALGDAGWFPRLAPEPQPVAVERFAAAARLLDATLADRPFVAGETFTIADIAHFGWFWRRAVARVEALAA